MASATMQLDAYHSLLLRLQQARQRTDALFGLLRPEALYLRSIPERHRIIFYLGHLEAFDWNLLARGAFDAKPLHAGFDRLFAFGIDPVDGNLPPDQPQDWPSGEAVRRYNAGCRETIDDLLAKPCASNGSRPLIADGTLLNVAIEHRLMHAETLAYLFHELPYSGKVPGPCGAPDEEPGFTPQSMVIPAGTATLGRPREPALFGWDNEFEILREYVPAFAIDAYPVTHGQFLEFVRQGGYAERSFWTAADWEWKEQQNLTHPHFWLPRSLTSSGNGQAGEFDYRGMFAQFPLPLAWPVYTSHAEAAAYARWAGKALPSEAQWHRAAYGTSRTAEPHRSAEQPYPWGQEDPEPEHGNFDFARWEPQSVNAHPAGRSFFGVSDLLGNGWEWTSTLFAPFPGFSAAPFYPGYSANFFDGQHYVLKGGSPQTAACMLRRSFRNWFQPHYLYSYATFRCVES